MAIIHNNVAYQLPINLRRKRKLTYRATVDIKEETMTRLKKEIMEKKSREGPSKNSNQMLKCRKSNLTSTPIGGTAELKISFPKKFLCVLL